jgi:hypothetical protein
VKPVLSDRCFACHGPDAGARKADLRLDTPEGARKVLRGGPFGRSAFVHRVTTSDSAEMMPPRESGLTLSAFERAVLARWADQGAEYKPHWSTIAPAKPALPAVRDTGWARTAIDRFVLARLEREGLKPAPEADRERLLRRVTYDLTGLPPTPDEVARFLADRARTRTSASWTGCSRRRRTASAWPPSGWTWRATPTATATRTTARA